MMTNITISQEGIDPIKISISDNNTKSEEGFLASIGISLLILYIAGCLIATPFIIADKIKNKRLLKLAEKVLSQLSESEKKEIKNFVNLILRTQKNIKENIIQNTLQNIAKKHINSINKYKIEFESINIVENEIIIKDNSEKSILNLLKEIVKILSDKKKSLESTYDIDISFIFHRYYDIENDNIFNVENTIIDNINKDLKTITQSTSFDKSKMSIKFTEFDETESMPTGSNGDCEKYISSTITLCINKNYIKKIFKPLYDKCMKIK